MLSYPQNIIQEFEMDSEARQWLSPKWAEVVDVIIAEWQEHSEIDVLRVAQRFAPERATEFTAVVADFILGTHPISTKGTSESGGAKRRSALG
jgi:hypothetical protein